MGTENTNCNPIRVEVFPLHNCALHIQGLNPNSLVISTKVSIFFFSLSRGVPGKYLEISQICFIKSLRDFAFDVCMTVHH